MANGWFLKIIVELKWTFRWNQHFVEIEEDWSWGGIEIVVESKSRWKSGRNFKMFYLIQNVVIWFKMLFVQKIEFAMLLSIEIVCSNRNMSLNAKSCVQPIGVCMFAHFRPSTIMFLSLLTSILILTLSRSLCNRCCYYCVHISNAPNR